MDLVEFLTARLDEDEQVARAAGDGWYGYDPEQAIAMVPVEDTQHIARHSPARVLAEVDAKRRVIAQWEDARSQARNPVSSDNYRAARIEQGALAEVMCLLALPYADHPDYDKAWRT